jgi:hypothetical protein
MINSLLTAAMLSAVVAADFGYGIFHLSASVLGNDLTPSVAGLELQFFHPGSNRHPCVSGDFFFAAAGTNFSTTTPARNVGIAPIDGDSNGWYAGLLITPGGTATVPSLNTVQGICDQLGTADIYQAPLSTDTYGLIFEDGAWMACPRKVLQLPGNPSEVILSYKKAGQRTIQGCADINLVLKGVL